MRSKNLVFVAAMLLLNPAGLAAQAADDGSVLPFPPTPMASVTKARLRDSKMQ